MPATRAAARQQLAAGVLTYEGLGDDLQDCIVASMNVTSILTYGACSRAAQSAVKRWKARIATLAGLGAAAPSGARIRVVLSLAMQRAHWSHRHLERFHGWPAAACFLQSTTGLYREPELPADILDFLTVCGITHFDAKAHFFTTYNETTEFLEYSMPAPPLECTIMQLAVKRSAHRIESNIVRVLKSAHAAGRGCGRPWIPTSRSALVDHIHAFPPLTATWNFGIRPTEVFIRHRIEDLLRREYAVVDEKDDELLYYDP